ncbi:DUF3375 domain-containing protein [Akkermansiaceae bacterium]|nr:DUF3375 domain-containing protein [Akkermansiaceae bacterium]
MILERVNLLQHLKNNHSSWRLLASRKAPLMLGVLENVFEEKPEIPYEDLIQKLGDIFAEFSNVEEFEITNSDTYSVAREEIREWIKKKLIVERDGLVLSTDSLQRAIQFVQQLDQQTMSSTASRLITVQNIIENLESQLNPNKETKVLSLKAKIASLEKELEFAKQGKIEVLDTDSASEAIKELFQQSMSLKADFRRVEDSYREADQLLRKKITKNDLDRGNVLDSLLDSHDDLLSTPEGKVFDGFYKQLSEKIKLEQMKHHLRFILSLPVSQYTLDNKQIADLRYLISTLVDESLRVIDARTRGENDVKSYVKTGLASENYRIGSLINQILESASEIDWQDSKTRRKKANLPPIGISLGNLPLIERLLCKELASDESSSLDLTTHSITSFDLDKDFWHSYHSLDRSKLFSDTKAFLETIPQPLPISELHKLSNLCQPEHDLEIITYWLCIAREAGQPFTEETDTVYITSADQAVKFKIPKVHLCHADLIGINHENLG